MPKLTLPIGRRRQSAPKRAAGLLLLTLCAVTGTVGCAQEPPAGPASIYIYLIDTLRPDHLGCYGYDRDTSPNIDAFAQEGYRFSKATTPSPWTRPAVASLFTGLLPRAHGARGRAGWLPAAFTTWAEAMQARGYATRGFVTNSNCDGYFGLAQGFDSYEVFPSTRYAYLPSHKLQDRWALRMQTSPPTGLEFQYLHSMDPHLPYVPRRIYQLPFENMPRPVDAWIADPEEATRATRLLNQYDAEILQNDDSFGKFVVALREQGLYDDSWIIVTSDHGEEFKEHGEFGHGHGLWETLLAIPLIIKPPKSLAQTHGDQLSIAADLPFYLQDLPDFIGQLTFPDWAPLSTENAARLQLSPSQLDSMLMMTARPQGSEAPVRVASFNLDKKSGVMVEQGGHKLWWNPSTEASFSLYDLNRDPGEVDDIFVSRSTSALLSDHDVVRALSPALRNWCTWTADGLELRYENPEDAPTPPTYVIQPAGGLREVIVPIGATGKLEWPGGEPLRLAWTPRPTARLILRGAEGTTFSIGWSDGSITWPDQIEVPGLTLTVHRIAPPLRPADRERSAVGVPDVIQQNLRALGYVD